MKKNISLLVSLTLAALIASCGGADQGSAEVPSTTPAPAGGHSHAEAPLGTIAIGDLSVELAQGHGVVAAGKEGHLVVKLPYSDQGSTIVRAWIGTEDRTDYFVGKGQYAPSHDDYDIHAAAPDPLPDGAEWWIEIEKPDGTKLVGAAKPILE